MNALTKIENTALTAMSEQELVTVLQSSLYPGAALASIKMVLGYCKAAGLDPMRKPVHIVPMWDGKKKEMRDVVMPGVGLYRTDAARTGEYAGITEPEFGPDVSEKLDGVPITFPQWCRVTVSRRMPSGDIVKFTAREFWKENYAVKGGQEKSIAPNAMWLKRPYGQIAKCAEAQALRKAFPEVGSQPTSDEMEGKNLREEYAGTTIDAGTGEIVGAKDEQPVATPYPDADFQANLAVWKKVIGKGQKPEDVINKVNSLNPATPLTEAQKAAIHALATPADKPEVTFAHVAGLIAKAANQDELNTAGDLIKEVADNAQKNELRGKYDDRAAELAAN